MLCLLIQILLLGFFELEILVLVILLAKAVAVLSAQLATLLLDVVFEVKLVVFFVGKVWLL